MRKCYTYSDFYCFTLAEWIVVKFAWLGDGNAFQLWFIHLQLLCKSSFDAILLRCKNTWILMLENSHKQRQHALTWILRWLKWFEVILATFEDSDFNHPNSQLSSLLLRRSKGDFFLWICVNDNSEAGSTLKHFVEKLYKLDFWLLKRVNSEFTHLFTWTTIFLRPFKTNNERQRGIEAWSK